MPKPRADVAREQVELGRPLDDRIRDVLASRPDSAFTLLDVYATTEHVDPAVAGLVLIAGGRAAIDGTLQPHREALQRLVQQHLVEEFPDARGGPYYAIARAR